MTSGVLHAVVWRPTGLQPKDATAIPRRTSQRRIAPPPPSQSLRYVYPPPLSEEDNVDESKLPKRPFPDAPSYMRSVYYYWWAYLRENEEYHAQYDATIGSSLNDLYHDFGDVRGEEFWTWWCDRGFLLFHENDGMVELTPSPTSGETSDRHALLRIPLTLDVDTALAQVRQLLQGRRREMEGSSRSSTARYPVVGTPVLPALHKTLMVLRAKRAHPESLNYEVFDLAGLSGCGPVGSELQSHRQDKSMEVSRRLREASRLMDAAAAGRFPGTAAEARQRQAAKAVARPTAMRRRAPPPGEDAAPFTAYALAPDLDITIETARPRPADEWFQVGGNTPSSLRRWDRTADFREKMHEITNWTYRVRGENRDWRLPELDPFISPELARVLFLLPLSMCEIEPLPFLKVASLRNASPSAMALFRMAIYQNRLPLHWCFPCSMYLYRVTGDEPEGGSGRRALGEAHIAELVALLPHLRAVVLVGHAVQETWDNANPSFGKGIKVWRCEEPSDVLKEHRPDLWLTIPSRLPARHDVGG